MSGTGVQRIVTCGDAGKGSGAGKTGVDVSGLNQLALNGLAEMFDEEKQLFCHRVRREGSRLVREGLSHRYTMMSLLGLQRARQNGLVSPIPVETVTRNLLRDTSWINNLGDLGLLLWMCALCAPERVNEVYAELGVADCLDRYQDGRERRSMELAWFLSGLAHAAMALPEVRPTVVPLAGRIHQLLSRNQGRHGFFGHQATWATFSGMLRGRIGSFADQVYPIYALARFAQTFGTASDLDQARNCADAICRTQGALGQWWWHYGASTGKVMQRYPVYAVHQDGMAPMALFALTDATGMDFTRAAYKGLAWIGGENELRRDVRNTSLNVVWRNIHRRQSSKRYGAALRDFLQLERARESSSDLRVLHECRPYHLGWILYAFAGRESEKPGRRFQ